MKKVFSFLLFATILSVACNTDSKEAGNEEEEEQTDERPAKKKNGAAKMAADVCGCITPLTNTLSPDAKRVFERAMKSDDPENTTEEEILKLDEDRQMKVAAEMEVIATAFQKEDSELNNCMNKVSKKYKDEPEDPKKAIRDLIKEMEKDDDCELGALIFKSYMESGMEDTKNNTNNNDDDDPVKNEE